MRSKFLVLYDYGQGGRWAIVLAPSAAEIKGRFPELDIVAERPSWMTDDYYRNLEARVYDIDKPSGLLADIVLDRK
jgi:hypothetical protein